MNQSVQVFRKRPIEFSAHFPTKVPRIRAGSMEYLMAIIDE